MMRSEIALWPQPAHSVVLPPRYGCISRPMRFIFLPGPASRSVVAIGYSRSGCDARAELGAASAASSPSCARMSSVTERASIGRPL